MVSEDVRDDVARLEEIYANESSNRIGDRAAYGQRQRATVEIGVSPRHRARIYLDRWLVRPSASV